MNFGSLLPLIAFILLSAGCTRHIKPTPIQLNARMSIPNPDGNETIFYLTKPTQKSFAIAVLCEGSTTPSDIESVWWVYQFEQFRLSRKWA